MLTAGVLPVASRCSNSRDDQKITSPFEALAAACADECLQLATPDADEEEETWEDLLEQEENAWDGGFVDQGALLQQHRVDLSPPLRQEVPDMSMAQLLEKLASGANSVCLLDVGASGSRDGQDEAAAALGLQRLHIPLEQLHAEAADGLKQRGGVIVVLPLEGNKKQELLAWQACVRLRSVYGVDAVLLRK